jgi:hypothetical protein
MSRMPLDLTTVELKDGEHRGQITKLEYQIKTGDKWNTAGTETVDETVFDNHSDVTTKRYHYTITEGANKVWVDFYLMDAALPFLLRFFKACGVHYDTTGFDPQDAVGKDIGFVVTIKDDNPNVTKYFKA